MRCMRSNPTLTTISRPVPPRNAANRVRNTKLLGHDGWNHRDDRKEPRPGIGDPFNNSFQILRRARRAQSWNEAAAVAHCLDMSSGLKTTVVQK